MSPLLLLLFGVNVLREYRTLRSAGVPRPGLIIRRRLRRSFLPPHRRRGVDVTGRQAWVAWDIRWLTAGQTLATVSSFDSATQQMALRLETPIVIEATADLPEVELTTVRLIPGRPDKADYEVSAVTGRLDPDISQGLAATAVVVVYPE